MLLSQSIPPSSSLTVSTTHTHFTRTKKHKNLLWTENNGYHSWSLYLTRYHNKYVILILWSSSLAGTISLHILKIRKQTREWWVLDWGRRTSQVLDPAFQSQGCHWDRTTPERSAALSSPDTPHRKESGNEKIISMSLPTTDLFAWASFWISPLGLLIPNKNGTAPLPPTLQCRSQEKFHMRTRLFQG